MDKLEELEKLAKLKEQWILTEDEFAREKRRVLEGRESEMNETERADPSNSEFSELPTYHDSSKDGLFAMLLSHRGRITRSQWICRIIVLYVVTIPGFLIVELAHESKSDLLDLSLLILAYLGLYGIVAVTSKRFHDFNTHGIAQVIPVYGLLAPLFKRGNGVDNRYGPPKTYSGIAEDVRPGLSPWFGWSILAGLVVIIAIAGFKGFTELESHKDTGSTWDTEAVGSPMISSDANVTDNYGDASYEIVSERVRTAASILINESAIQGKPFSDYVVTDLNDGNENDVLIAAWPHKVYANGNEVGSGSIYRVGKLDAKALGITEEMVSTSFSNGKKKPFVVAVLEMKVGGKSIREFQIAWIAFKDGKSVAVLVGTYSQKWKQDLKGLINARDSKWFAPVTDGWQRLP